MRIRALFSSMFLFWLFAGCVGEASAKPKSTTFDDMMKNSPTVAVAKLLDVPDRENHTVMLEIGEVFKGTLKPGKQKVSFEDFPHLGAKEREVVVFLDEKLVWRFVASPLDSRQPLDKAVLSVSGFYDYNAYFVSPGLFTLEQLKSYVKDKSLVYRFRGAIYFPQPSKTDWKASSLALTGSYDVTNKKVTVKGLPQLEGFPAQPDAFVESEGKINLTYARNLNRQLEIMGHVERLDGESGELVVQFAVSGPEVLTEKAFKEYLGDSHKGGFFTTFKLPCVPKQEKGEKRVLSLTLGKSTENDGNGKQLEGWDKDPINIVEVAYQSPNQSYGETRGTRFPEVVGKELSRKDGILRLAAKTGSGEFIILAFDVGDSLESKGPFTWSFQNPLRIALYTREIRGTVLVSDGKTVTTVATFTPEFDSMGFNRNDRK